MKKKKRSEPKKERNKKSTTTKPKVGAVPMRFNVLNFVLGSAITKDRGVSSPKATND